MPPRNDISAGLMSFGDHLEELRKRLFLAIVVPLPLSVVLFFFAPIIRGVLVLPALAAMEANGTPRGCRRSARPRS